MNAPFGPPSSPSPSSASGLRAGQCIGAERYVLKQLLGQGGMGVVWLAFDKRLQEPVALKFLPNQITSDTAALESLRRETARSRKLSHPNIIRIHDLSVGQNEPAFISMEYVDGPDLHSLRVSRPTKVLAWNFLLPLVRQLCAALDYAHGERIIHCDIKPANLLLDSTGRIKLADFGLACITHDSISRGSAHTQVGGTLPYMSPQQADGANPEVTDDIYALGATLYELLTSEAPFYSGDIAYQLRHNRPQPMAERLLEFGLTNEIPSEAAALIMACLAKEPAQRPQSAKGILEWLESFSPKTGQPTASSPTQTRAASEPAVSATAQPDVVPGTLPVTHFGRFAVIAFIILSMLGLGYWWVSSRTLPPKNATSSAQDTNGEPDSNDQHLIIANTNPPRTNVSRSSITFESLFNGRDLADWEGDPRVWSVKDGAIAGRSTKQALGVRQNTHLFWHGTVTNFELRFSFKLGQGSSGILYRCGRLSDWQAGGYEFELSTNSPGGMADHGPDRQRRDFVRGRGLNRNVLRPGDWNEGIIMAIGHRFVYYLNGTMLADVVDTNTHRRASSGLLALECQPEPQGSIYFKDLQLRHIPDQ